MTYDNLIVRSKCSVKIKQNSDEFEKAACDVNKTVNKFMKESDPLLDVASIAIFGVASRKLTPTPCWFREIRA